MGDGKFGPHHVMLKTPLSNLRITTFFAGESEVKIVDPSRVSEVQAVGCQVDFAPPKMNNHPMMPIPHVTKPSTELTLFDMLSRLSFHQAAKLLGPEGAASSPTGGKYDIDITTQVEFDRDEFRLEVDSATVTLSLSPAARDRLEWRCSACEVPCEHAGAAFSLILEEKLSLGLAGAPPERAPLESLSEEALVAQALAEREERARTEKMRLASR